MKHLNTSSKIQIGQFIKALFNKSTPLYIKALIGLALTYTIVPVDLLPDFLGPLAFLDDAAVLGLLTTLAMKLLEQHQNQEQSKHQDLLESPKHSSRTN